MDAGQAKIKLHRCRREGCPTIFRSSKYHIVSGREEVEREIEREKKPVLRQVFVTVGPKLCFAVKKNISQLKRRKRGQGFWWEGSEGLRAS